MVTAGFVSALRFGLPLLPALLPLRFLLRKGIHEPPPLAHGRLFRNSSNDLPDSGVIGMAGNRRSLRFG